MNHLGYVQFLNQVLKGILQLVCFLNIKYVYKPYSNSEKLFN